MPTLRQFEYLVALADHGHFGRAAAALHVSQPTLSQQLKQLEERLGAGLVDRGSNRVALTPIGRDVVGKARAILAEVNDVKWIAARSAERMAGTFRLGVTPTLGPYLLPEVIARLHREYPDMKLHIRDGIPDEQVQHLRNGALDLLLAPLPVVGDDIEIEPLFREPLSVVATPDHPLAAKVAVKQAELAGEHFLSLDPRHHYHRQVRDICDALGAVVLKDYEGTSLDSVRQMVASGIAMALLPELYLRSEAGGERSIVRLDVVDWSAYRSIGLIWRRSSPAAEMFRVVAEAIGEAARATMQSGSPSARQL
ncbi:hydrogen peroxide-inducible genes activator [Aurantiacibacter suaedae]|uniref:hydrogen peroxide-inducible genes activator n=1 Tax=Aurantiacibacter suaedae TaxID=2545755 RepID=UPI0010F524D1|nr:hydrogen peroxide-inducible genes activator [Aurantiacibacter suaedae]